MRRAILWSEAAGNLPLAEIKDLGKQESLSGRLASRECRRTPELERTSAGGLLAGVGSK